MSSQIENFLAKEIAQGEAHSSGHFSLSQEKALEKMAAFQLPDPTSWAAKIVQAGVAGGCPKLSIQQTYQATEWCFQSLPEIDPDTWEEAFFDPTTSPQTWLNHLKHGLWHVGIHGRRPFWIGLAGWSQALVWNGHSLQRVEVDRLTQTRLEVSHRRAETGKGWPLLSHLEAAKHNQLLLSELRRRVFASPMKVEVDSKRLDALQLCPGHGQSFASYPLSLNFLEAELPHLGLPAATFESYDQPQDMKTYLSRQLQLPPNPPAQYQIGALLTAHVEYIPGKGGGWKRRDHASQIYWILDGVLIDCRAFQQASSSVSLGLIASAEGLDTDLSGLALQINDAYRQRLDRITQAASQHLQTLATDLSDFTRAARQTGFRFAGLSSLLGAGTTLSPIPILAIFPFFFAAVWLIFAGSEEKALANGIAADLDQLQRRWRLSYHD